MKTNTSIISDTSIIILEPFKCISYIQESSDALIAKHRWKLQMSFVLLLHILHDHKHNYSVLQHILGVVEYSSGTPNCPQIKDVKNYPVSWSLMLIKLKSSIRKFDGHWPTDYGNVPIVKTTVSPSIPRFRLHGMNLISVLT